MIAAWKLIKEAVAFVADRFGDELLVKVIQQETTPYPAPNQAAHTRPQPRGRCAGLAPPPAGSPPPTQEFSPAPLCSQPTVMWSAGALLTFCCLVSSTGSGPSPGKRRVSWSLPRVPALRLLPASLRFLPALDLPRDTVLVWSQQRTTQWPGAQGSGPWQKLPLREQASGMEDVGTVPAGNSGKVFEVLAASCS